MAKNGIIKICKPDIGWREFWYVGKTLWRNELSGETKTVKEFEDAFAEYTGANYALAVSNGWAALFLAFWVLLWGKSILLPDITMIASANAAAMAGAHVVLSDVDKNGMLPIGDYKGAIMPVHLYGQTCHQRGDITIEDSAEYLARNMKIVTAACFSFYANKLITTGEGGMITTNDRALYEELYRLRSHYFGRGDKFFHEKMGFNFRMPALCAAVGLAQLKRADYLIEKRQQNALFYNKRIGHLVQTPAFNPEHAYWMYVIHTPQRDNLRKWLESCRIEVRNYFTPLHLQPEFRDSRDFPNADRLSQTGLLLPHANDAQKQFVCDKISEFFEIKRTGRSREVARLLIPSSAGIEVKALPQLLSAGV